MHACSASALINYRRVVYQKDERDLRITFDDQLQVFQRPVGRLFDAVDALTCERLDAPTWHVSSRIMEIKSVGPYPAWLDEVLGSYYPQKISKFITSVDFLSSHLLGRAGANGNGTGATDDTGVRDQKDGERKGRVKRQASDAEAPTPDPS